jgi:hypothetical protein
VLEISGISYPLSFGEPQQEMVAELAAHPEREATRSTLAWHLAKALEQAAAVNTARRR